MNVFGMKMVKALLDDPAWSAKLDKAMTNAEFEEVIREFCRERNFKVKEIKE